VGSEVKIRYALAKEYEDLGEYAKSFEQSRVGAKLRRDHLKYDVSRDGATVDWIISAFPAIPTVVAPGADMESPVFIVGLPRSGTTLVERILSSLHHCHRRRARFLCVVHRECGASAEPVRRQVPRQELVALSATLDFAALGRDYLHRVRRICDAALDSSIRLPLKLSVLRFDSSRMPRELIHVTRHPMAVCYAMYKTLFTQDIHSHYGSGQSAQYYIAITG